MNESSADQLQPDQRRQDAAKRYAGIRRRLYLVDLALGAAFGLLLIFGGLGASLRSAFLGWTGQQFLLVAVMLVVLSAAYAILLSPLSYLSGFRLPHRFGLSTQSFPAWLWDWIKGAALSLGLGLIVVEVVYYLLGAFPDLWWLLAAIAMLFFTVVLANLAPVLFVPLFYKLSPLGDADLAGRLIRLAERAGAHVGGVFVMDMSSKTTAANAALMGLGNTRRIVLGDTLLARYDPDEIETVLAHELGHHVHADIPKGIAVQSLLTLGGFYAVHLVLGWGVGYFGYAAPTDVAAMPLLALVIGAFGVVVMPLGNAFSRRIETQADRYALRMTAKPEAFARAMIKLADQNLSELQPPRWVELLFYDHPAAARRVQLARDFAGDGGLQPHPRRPT